MTFVIILLSGASCRHPDEPGDCSAVDIRASAFCCMPSRTPVRGTSGGLLGKSAVRAADWVAHYLLDDTCCYLFRTFYC